MLIVKQEEIQEIVSKIVSKDDFAVINGKIEITRDLALKLFAIAKLSYETQIQPTVTTSNEVVYIVKAKVFKGEEKVAEGLGACSTKEVSGLRAHHDALARAETRAFKRALEACVGLPFINEITLRLFGGYESIEAMKERIMKIKNIYELRNWWKKHQAEVNSLEGPKRAEILKLLSQKKRTFEEVEDVRANNQ